MPGPDTTAVVRPTTPGVTVPPTARHRGSSGAAPVAWVVLALVIVIVIVVVLFVARRRTAKRALPG